MTFPRTTESLTPTGATLVAGGTGVGRGIASDMAVAR
jgi:hypothetical protein